MSWRWIVWTSSNINTLGHNGVAIKDGLEIGVAIKDGLEIGM